MTVGYLGEDESPMPPITGVCRRCGVKETGAEIVERNVYVLVSPTGRAHYGSMEVVENTKCGLDATGLEWWWPI